MENIFTVSKPFLNVAQVLGLFPMGFAGPARKGFLTLKWFNIVISTLWLLILLCVMKFTLAFNDFVLDNSKVLPKALKLLTNMNVSWFLVHNLYQLYKRCNILQFLNTLHSSDEKVNIFQRMTIKNIIYFYTAFEKNLYKKCIFIYTRPEN